jgi:ABC-2 type transport system permease protein
MVMFAILLTALLYLGCTLHPWSRLAPVRRIQVLPLANPLPSIGEGFRAALTPADRLSLLIVSPMLDGFAAVLLWQGRTPSSAAS